MLYYDDVVWNTHASKVPQLYSILERRSNRLWQSVKFAARPVCPVTTSATPSGVPTPDGLRTSIRRPSMRTDRRADSISARAASGRSTSPRSSRARRISGRWGSRGIRVGSRYAAAVSRLVPMDMRWHPPCARLIAPSTMAPPAHLAQAIRSPFPYAATGPLLPYRRILLERCGCGLRPEGAGAS